ncbi:unnamed protein product [Microthlaspi erraticum]|uniref:C2H2-type domain-containing protein n=1 Tax=Microthlaspi erraticum TaxID=1685480 RepID=A0A6D2IQR5_9BRAS|nr:unnamed protein product [Microthlaspi erraticum]
MEHQHYPYHNPFERRPILKSKAPAVKWTKEWVPQDIVTTGGKCFLRKWVTEETVKRLKEKERESDVPEPEPEPTTEVLFLCSYGGCGKTFFDASALRKHSHIHGERQYVCDVVGCEKKFLDSSKLKRHSLIHTGARDFVCTHEGCGKAFSLDFNLRSHMKTHSQENYHICPYSGCGKRYAHEYKLKNHILAYHEKNVTGDTPKYTPPAEKVSRAVKTPAGGYGPATSERPYACPYDGCEKAYMHEYKLKLHLKREHPGHLQEENTENPTPTKHNGIDRNNVDDGSDQGFYRKHASNGKSQAHKQQSRAKPNMRTPPAKAVKKGPASSPVKARIAKKPWQVKETFQGGEREEEEEDSEETEEDRENVDDGWRFGDNNDDDDDEETEDED